MQLLVKYLRYLYVLTLLTPKVKSTTETGVGAVRFIRNNEYSPTQAWDSGIVEIYYGGTWGNICDDSEFTYFEANVICHQLGFTAASSSSYSAFFTEFGTDTRPMVMEDVSCSTQNYLVLLQCSVSHQYSSYCNNDDRDVVVYCYSTRFWDNPYSGQIRLAGGSYSSEGVLEVYCNGEWGTVCDDTFDNNAASVACRQLGYNTYKNYSHLAITGASQPIWLDDIDCGIGTCHNCLSNCQSCPPAESDICYHSEDITLVCETSLNLIGLDITTVDTCEFPGSETTCSSTSTIIATSATTSTTTSPTTTSTTTATTTTTTSTTPSTTTTSSTKSTTTTSTTTTSSTKSTTTTSTTTSTSSTTSTTNTHSTTTTSTTSSTTTSNPSFSNSISTTSSTVVTSTDEPVSSLIFIAAGIGGGFLLLAVAIVLLVCFVCCICCILGSAKQGINRDKSPKFHVQSSGMQMQEHVQYSAVQPPTYAQAIDPHLTQNLTATYPSVQALKYLPKHPQENDVHFNPPQVGQNTGTHYP